MFDEFAVGFGTIGRNSITNGFGSVVSPMSRGSQLMVISLSTGVESVLDVNSIALY